MDTMRQRAAGIWWLHPAFVFAAAGVVISIAAYIISESTYRAYWRTPKFFDEEALRITLFCVMVFEFGSLCGTRLASNASRTERAQRQDELPWRLKPLFSRSSFHRCPHGQCLWPPLRTG